MRSLVILNTRPMTQAASLTAALQAAGAQVIELPCLTILPPTNISAISHTLAKVNQYHYIIFVSRHAVDGIAPYWQPNTATLIAVGPSTQRAITALDAEALIPTTYSSAGIVNMPALQQIAGEKILIVCSEQVNAELYDHLITRGAQVDTLTSYKVSTPKINVSESLQHCQQQNVNLIISTSQASLDQLVAWCQPDDADWLFSQALIVISQKLHDAARQHGWPAALIIQSPNATTEAIVDTIRTCYSSE